MESRLPAVFEQLCDFVRTLLDWLRRQIHAHGQCYSAAELAVSITGRPLSAQPLLDQLRQEYQPLYG